METYRQYRIDQPIFIIMEDVYADLPEVVFTEVVLCLVNNQGQVTNRDICNTTGLSIRYIQRVRSKLEESKNPRETISRSRRSQEDSRKASDEEFMEKVRVIIDRSPTRSFVSISKELEVSDKTVRACVNEDLKCRSYRMQTGQLLTVPTKNRRLLKSTRLLNKLKHPKENNMIWFFSDEKNFCQDQMHNKQNNRWIAACPKDVPKVMKTKFPATVMVFGVVSNEVDVMPPHIFEVGLRVNTNIYLEVMEQTVLPWITGIAGGRPWVWQQDSAPCHVSNRSMAWLQEHC